MTRASMDEFNDFVEATGGNIGLSNVEILKQCNLSNKKINYIRQNYNKLFNKYCAIKIPVSKDQFEIYYNLTVYGKINDIDMLKTASGLTEEQLNYCTENFDGLVDRFNSKGSKTDTKPEVKPIEHWESGFKFIKLKGEELKTFTMLKDVFKEEYNNLALFNNPKVVIPSEITDACEKIQKKIGKFEFSIVLNGKWEGNIFTIEKTYQIPKQVVSSGEVNFINIDEHKCNTIIHSHPRGVTSFSRDDDKTVNSNFECSILFEDDKFKDCTINFYFGDVIIQITPEIEYYIWDVKIEGLENITKITDVKKEVKVEKTYPLQGYTNQSNAHLSSDLYENYDKYRYY